MNFNYEDYPMVYVSDSYTEEKKKEMSYKSAIFWYIKLKWSKPVYSDGFYNIYSFFLSQNKKNWRLKKMKICPIAFFGKFENSI